MNLQKESLELHRKHRGKLAVVSKVKLEDAVDLSLAYSPGVAAPCREIAANPALSYDLTNRGNTVAVVTDGTAVLGLGNIGRRRPCQSWRGRRFFLKNLPILTLTRSVWPSRMWDR